MRKIGRCGRDRVSDRWKDGIDATYWLEVTESYILFYSTAFSEKPLSSFVRAPSTREEEWKFPSDDFQMLLGLLFFFVARQSTHLRLWPGLLDTVKMESMGGQRILASVIVLRRRIGYLVAWFVNL